MSEEVVKGTALNRPPVFQIPCSSSRLWIMDPELTNNIALNNACAQMWRNSKCCWLMPIVTIMRPRSLEVENALIF